MAVSVIMPKLGNTVESIVLVKWHKQIGEQIALGEMLCEVETDKASMEVESTAAGTVLALLYKAGDEVAVMVDIAVVGDAGEAIPTVAKADDQAIPTNRWGRDGLSPRAYKLAMSAKVDLTSVKATGPHGRIIERDVAALIQTPSKLEPRLTPVARQMVASGEYALPATVDVTKRITKNDLSPTTLSSPDVEIVPLKGTRKVIAARMLASLQTTAQLTLNTSADARALQAYRQWLKQSPPSLGLTDITINDLILFAVARTLPAFPDLNALFQEHAIYRYHAVHLGMAVATDRGLIVPVLHNAPTLTLPALAQRAHHLTEICQQGHAAPTDLAGGTFTVTNLGGLGIESFTPVLNPPQVAILGVGNIQLKPVMSDEEVQFIPHLGLSLTINHQVVDGAPAARFLQALAATLAKIDQL